MIHFLYLDKVHSLDNRSSYLISHQAGELLSEHSKHTSCHSYVYVVLASSYLPILKIFDTFIFLVSKLMLQFVCIFSTGFSMPQGF